MRSVQSVLTLHQLLRRAFQLARALPSAPLEQFQRELGEPPTRTEVERLVKQRVGQPNFRDALLEFWDGRCALTGLDVRPLLRASHIKPWAECESDAERLDVYNGVLLAAHFDAAFDGGFITFDDEGRVLVSPALSSEARQLLGLVRFSSVKLHAGRRKYLPWHRERVFGR